MKKILVLVSVLLVTVPASAGVISGTWPRIGERKVLDSLACATMALTRYDQDHSCAETSAVVSGNNAAECRFVMNLTGNKTVWRLEGKYDANHYWHGTISQKLPTCTGFLCNYIGSATWFGHDPTPPQLYDYTFVSGNTAECAVDRISPTFVRGLFSGSY